ncbi:MAG TPA: signal peptidase I [Polyangiaceae bacterium]
MRLPRLRAPGRIQRELLFVAAIGATIASARSSLADHYVVPTGSMLPTVQLEDHVLVDKAAYGIRLPFAGGYAYYGAPPLRGDVVVLRSPEDGEVLLKRVIAVPGDRVSVIGGEVSINGARMPIVERGGAWLEELGKVSHTISLDDGGGPDYGPLALPDGKYLVLGDNRGNSKDGRWFGLVARDAILGRVEGVILRHGSPTWVRLGR